MAFSTKWRACKRPDFRGAVTAFSGKVMKFSFQISESTGTSNNSQKVRERTSLLMIPDIPFTNQQSIALSSKTFPYILMALSFFND
jgi:hypothetical protein